MNLTHIKITNMGPFESYEAVLPVVGLIQGENGVGKSSLQACIAYPFGGGHDPAIIHGTAEVGEVIITFDDGCLLRATAVRTGKGKKGGQTTREYKPKDGKAWLPAPDFISQIANAISYNPLKDLDADDGKQLEILLKIMPLSVDAEKYAEAISTVKSQMPLGYETWPTGNGIELIELSYDALFKVRTGVNREADTLTKHATALERDLPPVEQDGFDWDAELSRLRTVHSAASQELQREIDTLEATRLRINTEADRILKELHQDVDKDIDAKIAVLNQERVDRKAALKGERDASVTQQSEANLTRQTELRTEKQPGIEAAHQAVTRAEEQSKSAISNRQKRADAETAKKERDEVKAEATKLSTALDSLKALRLDLVKALSQQMPDLVIDAGRPCRYEQNGKVMTIEPGAKAPEDWSLVPFSKWNTASKIVFRLRLAVMARGKCAFVLVDSIGDLSPATLQAVDRACHALKDQFGIQWLFGSAKDGGPLRITQGLLPTEGGAE